MSTPTTILIVDDNPPMASTLEDIMTVKGYSVYAAFSGAEALEILHHHKVDILLTDVIMPDMNGVALYRKAIKSHPRMITFLMTAYAADEIIQQGVAEGIKTVLTKPIDIKLLLNLIMAVEQAYLRR